MQKKLLGLLFLGVFGILLNSGVYAQFDSSKKGSYAIRNCFLSANSGWLQFSGNDQTYTKTSLGQGARTFNNYGKFALFPEKDGYKLQVQFTDKTFGNWEVEETFKKEGARIFLMDRTLDSDNLIVNSQRFLIQKASEGHYIRTMDGRYLWYDLAKNAVELTGQQPESLPASQAKMFMWFIVPGGGF